MAQSNALGRALEYIIVENLSTTFAGEGLLLTPRTVLAQKRDSSKFNALSEQVKEEYQIYSGLVSKWLKDKFGIETAKKIIIDRISDLAAIAGDVTDIRINIDGKDVNLSIKHNHSAFKHQRPPRLAVQCGFAEKGAEDLTFRKSLDDIYLNFHSKRQKLFPRANSFNEIKAVDSNFIDDNLYLPTCLAVLEFINKHASNKLLAKSLFSFLVGNKDFYKITASKNAIEIQEFADTPLPQNVRAKLVGKSYVHLEFTNGWIISMRIHSAATLISATPSLKFDTQAVKIEVPKSVVMS